MTQIERVETLSHPGKWKPYPAYDSKMEWLGEIPAHWEVKRLNQVFRVVNGATPKSTEPAYWDGKIPWVTPEDLGSLNDRIISSTARMITEEGYQSCGTSLVPSGSLILSTRAPIGHLAIAGTALCTNQGCRSLVFRSNSDLSFFFYQLLAMNQEFQSWGQGSTFLELGKSKLEAIRMLVPPLTEQRAITNFLDRETAKIKALIAKKERLIELLQEKRTALISHAVTKGLDPTVPMKDSGVEWIGKIPAHWEVKRLKFVTFFVTSGSRGWAQYYSDEGAVFLRIGNLSRTSIALDLEDIQYVSPPDGTEGERTRVKQYDVLISITAYIGSIAVVSGDIGEAYVNQHIALTRPRKDVIDSKWLGYCLVSQVGQDQFRALLYGGTKDGLGLDDVKNLFCLVPPISEQHTIATYLDQETAKIDALISRIREGIEKLKEYSSALISAAVTGKIDVRETIGNNSEDRQDR